MRRNSDFNSATTNAEESGIMEGKEAYKKSVSRNFLLAHSDKEL